MDKGVVTYGCSYNSKRKGQSSDRDVFGPKFAACQQAAKVILAQKGVCFGAGKFPLSTFVDLSVA